jgi:hypothetical protein
MSLRRASPRKRQKYGVALKISPSWYRQPTLDAQLQQARAAKLKVRRHRKQRPGDMPVQLPLFADPLPEHRRS